MVKKVYGQKKTKTQITITQNGKKSSLQVPTRQVVKPELKGMELKSFLWQKVKELGNKASLKWQTSIAQMKDYVDNRRKYNPLQIKATGKVSFFKDRIKGAQYTIKNWKDASVHNLAPLINSLPDTSTFAMGVQLADGKQQFRTFTKKSLLACINNDFRVTSQTLGSDNIEVLDYMLDLSRDFRILNVEQSSDVPNHCNRQKNSVKIVGRCLVQDVYTKSNNCGYNVLKALGFDTQVAKKDQGGLSLNQMITLCALNNFPVKIIDSQGEEKYKNPQHNDVNKTIVVAIEEQHYYIFKDFTMTKDENRQMVKEQRRLKKIADKEIIQKNVVLVYYDLESVFNAQNQHMAQTYSLCYFPILLQENMPQISKDNLQSFVDQTNVVWGDDCCKQMVCQLQSDYIPTEFTYKFISFNGSSFDDYFLINQAVDDDENIQSCIFSNKSLIGLTFSYGKCWDLRKFLAQGSLSDNCKSFGTFPQKVEGFDHRLPQNAFDKGCLDSWIAENKAKIVEYNKFDVLSLYSLSMKFRDQVLQLFKDKNGKLIDQDADIFNHDTIGGQAFKLCKNKWKRDGIMMNRPQDEKTDKYIRKCLTAGRTQVMSTKDGSAIHLKDKKFQMIDVVSLYPTAMLNPNNFYPCGKQSWVDIRDPSKLGFYHIKVKQRDDLPNVLPQRDYNGVKPLDWCSKDEYETYCCSVDLDVLEEFGHQFQVLDGIEFSDKISGQELFACQLRFRDAKIIQDVNKEHRKDMYNGALREVCKLYLNSLSGKVIQRNFEKVTQIVKNTKELNMFMSKCVDQSVTCHTANNKFVVLNGQKSDSYGVSAKPSYLGVYIYAYARKLMYTQIFTKVQCHYTDTDSALIYYDDYKVFREQNPQLFAKENIILDGRQYQIKPFGTLDCEMKEFNDQNQWVGCTEAYLLAPKNYVVLNRETGYTPKLKCKGVSFKGSYCDEHKQIRGIVKCDKCDAGYCKYVDQTPLYQDPMRLFEQMVENKKCQVVCDQLTAKTFTNHHNIIIGIQFRSVTKTITIKSIITM